VSVGDHERALDDLHPLIANFDRLCCIETVLPSPREAALLESTTAMPMLLLNRRSLDVDGRPIELVRALYRGDRIAFETRLT
jgi:DNA-binding GntR family transcriptional regulator